MWIPYDDQKGLRAGDCDVESLRIGEESKTVSSLKLEVGVRRTNRGYYDDAALKTLEILRRPHPNPFDTILGL